MEEGALAIPPGNLTLVLEADSGDYMILNADYGDGSVEIFSIRFHNNMPNITHYYTKPGRLEAYFDLYCAYNLVSVFVEVYVVYPINNTTVNVTNTEPGGNNYIELTVDDGTDVNVTVLWGDGDITHELQANYTNLTTTLSHQYASSDPVTMTVLIYISNALSEYVHNITMGTDLHILNLGVTPSATIISSGDTVTFTRTLTQASQLHCSKDFGDGSSAYDFQETVPTSDTTDHQYTTIGDHHYNYTCWNHLDNATFLGTIFLNEAITGVVPSVEAEGAYVLDADFVVTWTFSTGEPAYFNASIDGIKANETTVSYSPTKEGSATFYAGMLLPGERLFKLRGENALAPSSNEFVISLDRLIAGLTFNMEIKDPDYVVVGRPTTVMVGQTNGSRVTDTVLLDGTTYYNASFPDLEGGPDSRNHSVWFSTPGTTVVSLVSSNTVGNVTASNTFTVRAEVPLDNVTLQVSCGCVGSKEATLSLVLSEGLPPTNTLVDIDYGDGTTVTGVTVSITGVGDAGAAKFTHTYATTNMYYATVTASNPVSLLSETDVLVDIAEEITDPNVGIPTATVFGEVTSIDVTAASGTDVNVTCSFGDGTDDYFASYATASLIETPINHTFGVIGDHNVTVTIANSKLTYVKSRIVQVDQVAEGYGRKASNAIFGSANSVNVNTTHGSRMNLFVDTDVEGGDGYVYDICVDTSPSSTQIDFTYTVAGVYLVRVSLTNSLSQIHDKFALAANFLVENFNMVGPSAVNFTDVATFNRTLTGSHVSCNVQYGDGNVELTYEDTPDALMVFDYNYTEIGVYDFEASCYNYISEESAAWTVYVQEAMVGYEIYPDMTFAATGQPLYFSLNITAGTNVTVSVTYSPLRADVNDFVTWDGLSGHLELPYPVHGFGLHNVNITIGNVVTRIENVFQVGIDEALSNFTVITDEYVTAGTEIVLTVSANTGSNVCVGIDYDDGTDQEKYTTSSLTETCTVDASFLRARCGDPDITQADCEALPCCYNAAEPTVKCFMPDVITDSWNLTIRKTFTTDGLREIGVSADNSVTSAFRVARVYVEYPVEDISIVDITMARVYQFGIHLNADPPPTDASVYIEFTDGGDNVTVPFTATLGSDQVIERTLPSDDVFEATITICNNVSCLVLPHLLAPEAPFVNTSLVLLGPQLPGDAHNLTLLFDQGLSGNLFCDMGDGTSVKYEIKGINYIPEMNHTYGDIGSYEVTCVLNNTLSSEEFKHIADVDIDITGVTLNFSHISLPDDQPPYPLTVYTITAETGSRLNILLYDTLCGNVAYQATNNVSDIMSPSFNCTYDEVPTLNPGKLEIFNSRTLVEIFFTHAMQEDFRNVAIGINKDVLVFGVEAIEFMMTGGGNSANISYDLGDGFRYETNLTSDGHNYSYVHPVDGTFNYTVTLTNYVDTFIKTGTVHVEIEISVECEPDFSFELGGPLCVKCQWSGTNGEPIAYFDGAEVTPEVDYLNKTANITIADPEVGTSTVIFNVSNHISTAGTVVNINIDAMIADLELSTTASYTAVNESFTLTANTVSGTRPTWFIAYGDSSNTSVDDSSIVVSGNHTISAQYAYPNPGYQDIIVMVSNSLVTLYRSIFHGAEFPIVKDNLAVEVPTKIDRPGVEFNWSISLVNGDPPTGVEADLDWTDVVEENVSLDLKLDEIIYKNHQYSTYFTPSEMTAFLRNNISNATWTSLIQVGIDIEGLNLTADRNYKQVNETVEFKLYLDKGSRVMHQLETGDGSPDVIIFRNDPGSWGTYDIQFANHTYIQSGLFTATLTANNSLGTVAVSESVKVEYCILGTEIQPTPPIAHPPGVVQYTISVVDDQYMSPTDVTCDFDYGNGETGTVSAVFNANKEFQHVHTYALSTSPGYYNTTVNCYNYVCSSDYLTEVLLIEPIAEITIDIINEYIEAPGFGNFTLGITNGSHLIVTVDYGDGSPNTSYTVTQPPAIIQVSHLYETDMNSTLSVEVRNVLQSQTTVSPVKFVIQNPIIELILTSNSPIDYAASTGQFYIDIEPSSTAPTDVFCKWKFFNGGVEETTFAGPLRNHDTHEAETTYTYSEIGEQTVNINCSNYISRKTYSLVIEVAEAIEGVDFVADHTHGKVGETVIMFTLSVTHGSNVSASIDFGDGETATVAFADLIANTNPVVITHIYNITGFFLPVATVYNSLGEPQQAQLTGSEEVVIEHPILPDGIEISGLNVTRYAETVTFKAEQIQTNAPSNTLIKWIYGNGEESEESLMFSDRTYNHSYDYSTDGWYHVTAIMRNNVSSAEATFLEQVGTRILGVNVEAPKNVRTRRETKYIAHVDQGSEVEYIITIGNGDITPVQKRYDNVSAGGWLAPDDTEIIHTISAPGDFSLQLTATNVFDNITVDLSYTINVEDGINTSNISPLETHPIPDGQVEIIIENLEERPPTDAKCDCYYGDDLSDIGVDMIMTAENRFVQAHQYQDILPGVRTININCSNQVSSQTYSGTVMLQEPISLPTAGIVQPYVKTNAISDSWLLITNGTHVTYDINHGDGLSTERFIEYPPKVTETVNFEHAYAVPNNYTISITLTNDISNQSLVISQKMVVQNPLTAMNLRGDQANPYPPGDFNLTVEANRNAPPTDVFCRYKFYLGQPLVESFVADSLGIGEKHIQRHTYTRDKLGTHYIFVNCSNYVSYRVESYKIWVDEVITGFKVYNSTMYVETGTSVTLTYSVVEGTNVDAYLKIGDIVSEWKTWSQFEASLVNLTFEKAFDTAANHSVTYVAKNDISQMTLSPPEELVIQNPVPEVYVTTSSPVYARGIGQLIVTPKPGAKAGTDVFVSWKSDYEEWETYSASLGGGSTHIEDYEFQTIGDTLFDVVVKNKVSEYVTSLLVHVQEIIEYPYIEPDRKSVLVNESTSFSIGVHNGSHLRCIIDFKDGSDLLVVTHQDQLTGKSMLISHRFVQTGNLSISVTFNNSVSQKTITASEELIVQGDIGYFIISGPPTILVDLPQPVDAVFTIRALPHGEVPKNVHLAWSVNNESLYTYVDTYKSDYTYDLSYRFDGSVLGPVNIAVNASNIMRWNIANMTTRVYLKIKDLDLNVTSSTLVVNSAIKVNVWVSSGSEITCKIGYGDGMQDSHYIPDYHSICQFEHEYASAGNYSINVTATNDVSQLSKKHSELIIVQVPVDSKDMTLITDKYLANPPGKATFELMVNSGEPIPTDVHVTANYGDGGIQNIFVTAFPLKLMYTYPTALAERQIGEKVIVINMTNLVSSDSIVDTIHLQEPINIASLNHPKFTEVNSLTPIIVIFDTGSDIEVLTKCGDGKDYYSQVDGKVESVQVNATYSKAGVYSIEVSSRNEVSEDKFIEPDALEAQHPVRNIQLLPVGPYLKLGADGNPNQPANFTIIKTPGSEIPSNTTITIIFGDDKPDFSEEKMISPRYSHQYIYDQVGNYSFEVIVFNGVSSLTFNGTVLAQMEITGCDFSVEQAEDQDDDPKIRVNTVVTLKATASGSGIIFTLRPEPGVSISSIDPEFAYRFQQLGTFSVELECSNFVSKMTKVHDVQSISGIDIDNVGFEPAVELNTTVIFIIYLKEAVDEVCFSYDFQSLMSTFKFWRGDLEVCKVGSDFNEEKYSEMEQVSSDGLAYTTVRRFLSVAEYNVTFTAFDKVASISAIRHLSVTKVPCNAPSMTASEGASVNETLRYKRSQEFTLSTSQFTVTKSCKATDVYITSLKIYFYMVTKTDSEWVRLDIDNPLGEGDTVRSFLMKRNTLNYGQYYMLYTLQPDGLPEKISSSKIYFKIEGTALTASINNKKLDVVGTMRPYRLTVFANDPDDDPRPFGYEKYCIPKSDIWSNETVEDVIHRLDKNELVEVPSGTPTDVAPSDQVGCYGKRTGRLNLHAADSLLEFNTGWMIHSKTYVFLVWVSKGERKVIVQIDVRIAEGNPPQITIECYGNGGNCRQGVRKVNPTKPLELTFLCDNCQDNSVPTFETAFKRLGKPFEIPPGKVKKAKLTTLGDGKTILWSQDVSYFTNPGFYELEVTIKLLGFPDGFSAFSFAVNQQPHGGTVIIQPPPGSQLSAEEFVPRPWIDLSIVAVGWGDDGDEVVTVDETEDPARKRREVPAEVTYEENHPDLTFSYSYIKKGKEIPIFGDPVKLPEGHSSEDHMIEIIVVVTDNYGGKVTYSKFFKVEEQVYDDPEEAAAAEAKTEELKDSIINQDLSKATDVASALSQIISAVSDTEEPTVGSGSTAPGSETTKEEAEAARVEEAKQQDRLETVMTGLVNLATSDSSDPETIKATFKAYAVIVKQQTGAASSEMKADSLDIAASFLDNIDEQGEDKEEFVNSFVDTMGDAINGALATEAPPAEPEEDDVPSEDEDDSDDEAAAAAKAAEQEELAKKAAANLVSSSNSIVDAMKGDVIIDGEPLTVGDKKLSVTIAITSLQRVNGTTLESGGSSVTFPPLQPLTAEDLKEFAIFFKMMYSKINPYVWDVSARDITDGVTILDLTDQDDNPLEFDELTEPLQIDMEQTEALDNWANMDNMTVDQQSNLIYMYVPVDVDRSAFIMELDLNTFDDSTDIYFEVYFKFGATDAIMDRPNTTRGSYDIIREVPDRTKPFPWVIIIAEAQVLLPGIYIGVLPKVRNSTKLFNQTTVPQFNMRSSLPRCRSWDMTQEIWSGQSCKVGHDSSIDNTRCRCDELNRAVRTYSGGLSVPKVNTIDFSKVFANFSDLLSANPTVLATILIIFIMYLLLLIWARRADQKDMEKWCVTPLVDNPLNCPHLYKVSVYTGLRQGAGTHSKVCFIVSGENGDTGVRVLDDGRGKNFERATLRHFLMTSEQPLGELTFMRVWHDNSGQGPAASWFLDKIVIEDILGRTRYFFLNGRWLAVDEDDGQVDRLLPTAAHEEIDGFNHIFFSQARHNLTDDHLWISVLSRPTKSSFTRAQRLTCCLALLCTTMVANAMWYGSAGEVEEDQVIRIGPIVLSVAVLLVSIFSSLTVVPINLILVQLFRKSRPRDSTELPDGSEVRTTETGQKDIAYMRRFSMAEKNDGEDEKKDDEGKKSKKKEPRKYWFPWWGIVIAWVVALLASIGSLFFVLLYSLQWGKLKSEEWLSSLLMAFFQSVIIIQPFKVIVVAMMMSLIFKKFKDEEEELPLNPTTGPGSEDYDEVLHIDRQMFADIPMMPNKRKLEKARRQRELDKKLTSILLEIMSYFFFLLLVAFIAFGSFDIQRYRHANHLRRLLQGAKKNHTVQWVSDQTKMWNYLDVTVADVLFNVRDYSNSLTIRSDRRYLKDNKNVRVGAVRLRQVRVKPALCEPPDVTRGLILECNPPYHVTREQKSNFSTFWLNLPVNHTDAATELEEAFRYKDIIELKGSLTIGRQALYNGGGYVANLGTSPNKARRVMQDLMNAFWVDYYTRAVFLEFTVYNANTNLFGFVQYVFEIPASGGVLPLTFVHSFSVYTVFSVMGTVVLVCQILYILILLYIIVREIRKLRKETPKVYFLNPWNVYEVVVIVASLIAIGMYGAREAVGRLVTKELSDNKDDHTYYERLATYNDVLTVVIGLVVFLTNIRFMRLMRLNHHVVDLYRTLKDARKELMYFSVTFFIVFSSYSLPAVIFFGTWMYGHSDIFRSVSGTFNILLGRLYWYDMMIASPWITPVYFFTLVVTLYFILVNMFISILTASYRWVQLTPDQERESDYKIMAFVSAKIASVCCCCSTKKQPEMGKDYLDNLDSLDDRVNHINNMINNYYRENIKSKYLESKPKAMETKGDMNDPATKKKMFADMFHF